MGLPQGTVTFLFTDLEGSTRLWEAHPQEMKDALARHNTIVRAAVESHNGVVFSTMGDVISAGSQHAWLTSRPHPSPRSCLRGDLCWPQRRQRCSFCGQQPGSITPGA